MSKGGGHSGHHHSSSHHHHHHHSYNRYNNGYRSTTTYYNNGGYNSYSYTYVHPAVNNKFCGMFFLTIIFGTLISIPYFILLAGSHISLDMDPEQTTLKSLHPIWIKYVTITDETGNGNYLNAALYSTPPVIASNKTHEVKKDEDPLIGEDDYMYYSYQLNKGSSAYITFKPTQALNFYIQKGDSQFKKFTEDVDGNYYKLKKYCDNGASCSVQYQIGSDDIYYFTFQNPSRSSQIQVNVDLQIQMTVYEPTSKAIDSCVGQGNVENTPNMCRLNLPFAFDYSKKLYMMIQAPSEKNDSDLTYPTEYKLFFNQGMVWGQGILSVLALVVLVYLMRLYCTGKCSNLCCCCPGQKKSEGSVLPSSNPYSTTIDNGAINVINENTTLLESNDYVPTAYPVSSNNNTLYEQNTSLVTPSAPIYEPSLIAPVNEVNTSVPIYQPNVNNNYQNDSNKSNSVPPYGFINN